MKHHIRLPSWLARDQNRPGVKEARHTSWALSRSARVLRIQLLSWREALSVQGVSRGGCPWQRCLGECCQARKGDIKSSDSAVQLLEEAGGLDLLAACALQEVRPARRAAAGVAELVRLRVLWCSQEASDGLRRAMCNLAALRRSEGGPWTASWTVAEEACMATVSKTSEGSKIPRDGRFLATSNVLVYRTDPHPMVEWERGTFMAPRRPPTATNDKNTDV
ncbi:hypothetical protein NDU88_004579 [Pleurodeles waltl]|uniref:Uncharacterized protein n=1 Tax=Pleurodeles waltl TaxID=8319 RepID=A0AAV7T9J2_PLEWA|nr:hypothetical protein NDU88_004579 [Pleurodeles waltl]